MTVIKSNSVINNPVVVTGIYQNYVSAAHVKDYEGICQFGNFG